ncbi:protein-S-isoprenylcysteine O-methyltransferase isoform X1 [Lethenteron reissneri]|uniref:protein-S-isoprenylcysteine O-methyltransferase isoform X1 n=1 Tax=Lethenteron reissneri TaxID=7753 RepID=UPI002AB62198|nr:protein-S-isoprenylcysteine O-methyltransferase isoform X1 [Lethenteron reissneri]
MYVELLSHPNVANRTNRRCGPISRHGSIGRGVTVKERQEMRGVGIDTHTHGTKGNRHGRDAHLVLNLCVLCVCAVCVLCVCCVCAVCVCAVCVCCVCVLCVCAVYVCVCCVCVLCVCAVCVCASQVAVRACFLGFAFGCGLILSLSNTSWKHFGWYVCSLSFFHYSEYLVTALINPRSLNLDSFLLNHSLEYKLAAVASWVEFTLEMLLFPGLKDVRWLSVAGLAMVVGGEALRKAAMLTAGSNFSHIVQSERSESHQLVTRGVYAFSRHPSYVGWFYWSIGTQIILCNPLCLVGYTVASWRFFRERIEDEELTLLNFFGEQYMDYKTNVPTRLPFIDGFRVEL